MEGLVNPLNFVILIVLGLIFAVVIAVKKEH